MSDATPPDGWAGFAAPAARGAILVPLAPAVLQAGEPLAERARERAMQRYGDYGVAADILAGNALFALRDDRNARGAIAACLGGIARLTQSRCFVMVAVMRGHGVDCTLMRLDRQEQPANRRAAVRARLAAVMALPADRIVPGELLRGGEGFDEGQTDGASGTEPPGTGR